MGTLKAKVRAGRLVLDVPTKLPNGTEVELTIADQDDGLNDDERAALHAALAKSCESAKAGRTVPADDFLEQLWRK